MGLNGPLAGVVGGVVLILGVACYFLFQAYTSQVEQRVAFEVQAKMAEKSLEHQREISKINQQWNEKYEKKVHEYKIQSESYINEINNLRVTAEKLSQRDPFGFGNDIDARVKRVFCLFEARGNHEAIESCRSAPDKAFASGESLFITVTQEQAEIWGELCGDARQGRLDKEYEDFCTWSITGMTPQGLLNFLVALEVHAQSDEALDAYSDTLQGLIEDIIQKIDTQGK